MVHDDQPRITADPRRLHHRGNASARQGRLPRAEHRCHTQGHRRSASLAQRPGQPEHPHRIRAGPVHARRFGTAGVPAEQHSLPQTEAESGLTVTSRTTPGRADAHCPRQMRAPSARPAARVSGATPTRVPRKLTRWQWPRGLRARTGSVGTRRGRRSRSHAPGGRAGQSRAVLRRGRRSGRRS